MLIFDFFTIAKKIKDYSINFFNTGYLLYASEAFLFGFKYINFLSALM